MTFETRFEREIEGFGLKAPPKTRSAFNALRNLLRAAMVCDTQTPDVWERYLYEPQPESPQAKFELLSEKYYVDYNEFLNEFNTHNKEYLFSVHYDSWAKRLHAPTCEGLYAVDEEGNKKLEIRFTPNSDAGTAFNGVVIPPHVYPTLDFYSPKYLFEKLHPQSRAVTKVYFHADGDIEGDVRTVVQRNSQTQRLPLSIRQLRRLTTILTSIEHNVWDRQNYKAPSTNHNLSSR